MTALAVEVAIMVLAPLFLGSVGLIHELRGGPRDVAPSVRIAAGIWSGLGLGIVALLVGTAALR